jgi:hypothetical protein
VTAGRLGLQRQPSWADNLRTALVTERERRLRCMTCYPPVHLAPERVEIVVP